MARPTKEPTERPDVYIESIRLTRGHTLSRKPLAPLTGKVEFNIKDESYEMILDEKDTADLMVLLWAPLKRRVAKVSHHLLAAIAEQYEVDGHTGESP